MMTDDWLILHGGALGDLVLTIQLVLRFPDACATRHLRLVSRTNPGDLSRCRPSILRQSPEGLGLHWLFGEGDDPPERLLDVVRGARVLNALGGPDTAVHRRLTELAPATLYSLDPRPRDGVQRHITEQWITQLEAQGLLVPKCVHQRPAYSSLGVPDELRRPAQQMLLARDFGTRAIRARSASDGLPDGLDPPANSLARARGSAAARNGVAVVHPGSGGRAKCWPLRCFTEVARLLQREQQHSVRFVVGHVEQETWPADELAALAREFTLLPGPSPDTLATLLAAADAFLGNDAGPAHLAALLGTPTVAIFGPTSPIIWRPLGPNVRVLAGDPASSPDDWGITPADVVHVIDEDV